MAEYTTEPRGRPGPETRAEVTREKPMKVVAGGSAAEAIGGLATVVLAILGIVGVLPYAMAAISSICIGAALLLGGAAITSRYTKLVSEAKSREGAELGAGVSAEVLAGLAAIALGILALLGVAPLTLLAVSVLVIGGALIIGSSAMSRINSLAILGHATEDRAVRAASETVNTAAGAQILVGIGAIVLGILAILEIAEPLTLILVAFLALGASALLSGGAVSGKVTTLLSR